MVSMVISRVFVASCSVEEILIYKVQVQKKNFKVSREPLTRRASGAEERLQ